MRPALTALRTFVTTSMNATVQTGTTTTTVDPLTGLDTFTFVPEWTGKAHIWTTEGAKTVTGGAGTWTVRTFNAIVPAGAPMVLNRVLKVTAAPDAPELVGEAGVIRHVQLNSTRVAQQLEIELTGQ